MDVARLPTTPSRGRRNSVALRMYVLYAPFSLRLGLLWSSSAGRARARARGAFPLNGSVRPRALESPRTSGGAEERQHSRSDKAPIVLR